MRKTALWMAITVALAGFTPALGQSQATTPPTAAGPSGQQLYDASQFRAPAGHRQPKPAETKPEAGAIESMEDLDRENALLARRIGGICRGC